MITGPARKNSPILSSIDTHRGQKKVVTTAAKSGQITAGKAGKGQFL